MHAARLLLDGIVDYAGLFPPTGAPMTEAVREYAHQRASAEAWMLGAFVVPAGRLEEMASSGNGVAPPAGSDDPWPLSVLVGDDVEGGLARIRDFLAGPGAGRFRLAAVEAKPASPESARTSRDSDAGAELFFELPWDGDPGPWIAALKGGRAMAKLRCGGVTPDLIPPVGRVAEFLRLCHRAGLGLKCTAGLHHPVRSVHPLTYEADAPRAMMHGFLNLFVAAALVATERIDDLTLLAVLEETDAAAFRIGPDEVAWRDRAVASAELAGARAFARSFGSCSFAEPVQDLHQLGML